MDDKATSEITLKRAPSCGCYSLFGNGQWAWCDVLKFVELVMLRRRKVCNRNVATIKFMRGASRRKEAKIRENPRNTFAWAMSGIKCAFTFASNCVDTRRHTFCAPATPTQKEGQLTAASNLGSRACLASISFVQLQRHDEEKEDIYR